MKKQCWEQLKELMTNYGKIDMLWFDGEWLALGGISWKDNGWTRDPDWINSKFLQVNYFWESEKLVNMIRSLQPDIMINNRGGWEGDFHVRERRLGSMRTDKPWDSNDCIADSWGYIPGRPVLSLEQLIKNLVSIIVRDGNYLLNVGPTGDGEIEPCQVKRLAELGEWLTKYGKALYGTRGGPILPGDWGGSTYRGNKVYLHIINWEVQDSITFPAPGKLLSSYGLNCNQFNILEVGDSLEIQVAADARDPFDTIICLTFEKDIIWDGVAATEDDIYGLADGLKKAD